MTAFASTVQDRPRVLLVMEQCNPSWSSVPLVAYKFYDGIRRLAEVTLVTHERNRRALSDVEPIGSIIYIQERPLIQKYYQLTTQLTSRGRKNWPLQHVLTYPVYADFNHQVYVQFAAAVRQGSFDIVHVMTPMMPRYPAKISRACSHTPFILGPVNGGVPFPPGFETVARQEFSYLNFLRRLGRAVLPEYVQTYQRADRILAGSTYTLNLVKELFSISDPKLQLFYENGIPDHFFSQGSLTHRRPSVQDPVELLFVGRLVPYKGADMLIEALAQLTSHQVWHLTIVGDGSERTALETLVDQKGLAAQVTFTGWIPQESTADYYQQADLFCFPSIREFGGAVVLEAMASGLPCVVVNNGGIGEYITDATGFRIDPISREAVINQTASAIKTLIEDLDLRLQMGQAAIERANAFRWSTKASQILEMYQTLLSTASQST